MSEFNSNPDRTPEQQVHDPAERQTAASSSVQAAAPAPSTNPMANLDTQKLLALLKNPSASRKLDPQSDWIYGAISSAVGVLGFFFWVWALQESIKQQVNDFLGGFGGGIPIFSLFGFATPGRFLVIGIFSIALIVGALTVIGNWSGARKRSWIESATYQGGTQLPFGAGLIAAGIIAFVSIELSTLVGIFVLLLSLIVLVTQALELHEVSAERRFAFLWQSLASYLLLLYVVYSVVG